MVFDDMGDMASVTLYESTGNATTRLCLGGLIPAYYSRTERIIDYQLRVNAVI